MLESVSDHFANLRDEKLCRTCVSGQNALFRGTELQNKVSLRRHHSYSLISKMTLGSVSVHFENLRQKKLCKACVPAVNALFQGIELSKNVSQRTNPIYFIRSKMMFGSVLEHFADLRHEKWCKTYVSGLNPLFRGTELPEKGFATNAPNLLH